LCHHCLIHTYLDFSKEEEIQSNKLQEQRIRLQPLDSQLENLRYEQDCYASEIDQCRQYGYSLLLLLLLLLFLLEKYDFLILYDIALMI